MRGSWTRRAFLARTGGAAAGVLALGAGACSSDDGDDDTASRDDDEVPRAVMPPTSDDGVPTAAAMFGWIQQIFDQGIRRVGYPADEWTEQFVAEQFRAFGLEDVRLEPVRATRWEPLNWSLEATPEGGDARTLECFPLPYAAPTEEVELELVAYDPDRPELVEGKASLWEEAVIRPPADVFLHAGSAPADSTGRVHDPDGTLGNEHVLPFGPQFLEVMEPSMEAGAAAFVGYVQGYPKESCTLYNPYDAIERPIPGVYVKESDGLWLREQLAQGPVRIGWWWRRPPRRSRPTTWSASSPVPTTTW